MGRHSRRVADTAAIKLIASVKLLLTFRLQGERQCFFFIVIVSLAVIGSCGGGGTDKVGAIYAAIASIQQTRRESEIY